MGYTLIHETTQKAAKRYLCIWCGEPILLGHVYVRERSVYEGDPQNHKWHPECRDASLEYFRKVDNEFSPHENERPPSLATLEYESWDCELPKAGAAVEPVDERAAFEAFYNRQTDVGWLATRDLAWLVWQEARATLQVDPAQALRPQGIEGEKT